jgi:hypothetical protein
MREDRRVEHYEFYCQPCNSAWLISYEVRIAPDLESDVPRFFYLYGLPATPPSAGRLCPNCWVPSHSCQLVHAPALAASHR